MQTGGGACDEILNDFNPCDIIREVLKIVVEYVVEKPIYGLIDIINIFIRRINELIWLILNYIIQVFTTIISLINGPIIAVNILTRELKQLLNLTIDLLTGDILSIAVVYTLPLFLYISQILSVQFDIFLTVIMTLIQYIFSLVGIKISNNSSSFGYYHLIILIKSINIIAYLICFSGFIELIF